MISGILVILIAWYFIQCVVKPLALAMGSINNPKYWDKFGTKYEVHITEEDYKQLKKKLK